MDSVPFSDAAAAFAIVLTLVWAGVAAALLGSFVRHSRRATTPPPPAGRPGGPDFQPAMGGVRRRRGGRFGRAMHRWSISFMPPLRNGNHPRCVVGGGSLHFYGMVVGWIHVVMVTNRPMEKLLYNGIVRLERAL